MDSAASSKRKRAGSSPAESARAAFDYWLGREVLNLEERDRYSHAVPGLCRRISGGLATNEARDGSTPSRDTNRSRGRMPLCASEARPCSSTLHGSACESRAWFDAPRARRPTPVLGIAPVWSNGRTRAFEAQGRGSTPRTGTGEVSPSGEGCGLTRRRARFDSGTSYPNEAREMHRDVGDVAGPDKSVQQGSTPWWCTVRGETAGKSPA